MPMVKSGDLSTVLVERYGLSKGEAEQFVAQIFAVVADELDEENKSVKIKGLGTFKVTAVNSRESVDVNTGERIRIEGRNKISFTPDAQMRDRVNRPFAPFETVELNDGVDFSSIDNEDVVPTGDGDPAGMEECAVAEDVHGEESAAVACETFADAADEKNDNEIEKPQNTEHVDQTETSVTEPDNNAVTETSVLDGTSPDAVSESHDDCGHCSRNCHRRHTSRWAYVGISLLFLIVGCCGAGLYIMYRQIQQQKVRMEALESDALQRKNTVRSIVPVVKTVPTDTVAAVKVVAKNDTVVKEKPTTESSVVEEKPQADYTSDYRIRTGAYVIEGIAETVTVKAGQTLPSISKAYLGEGMECYVEAVNGCNTVRVGDKIKIPKLRVKARKKK